MVTRLKHFGHPKFGSSFELRLFSESEIGDPPPLAETHVLIGWYKDKAHLDWVLDKKRYNFRMDIENGSLYLRPEVSGARYLLLHSYKGTTSTLFKIQKLGPRVLSKKAMIGLEYPGKDPKDFYLVFDVVPAEGFEGYEWDYRKLPERLKNRQSAEPQTITLDALMAAAGRNLLAGL